MGNLFSEERRRARRLTEITFQSYVRLTDENRSCLVRDVSEVGARVEIERPQDLSPEIELVLSGAITRRCRIVWRSRNAVGVTWHWMGDASVRQAWRAIFRD